LRRRLRLPSVVRRLLLLPRLRLRLCVLLRRLRLLLRVLELPTLSISAARLFALLLLLLLLG